MTKFFSLIFIIFSISLSSFEQEYTSAQSKLSLLVHKTPTCGCCKKWVKHLEANSFSTMIKDHQNLQKVKDQYSIKPKYQSCHTAVSQATRRDMMLPDATFAANLRIENRITLETSITWHIRNP